MKVPYSWLKDYVDVKIDPKKLAYLLTMAGAHVASCEKVGGDYILEFEITANRTDCLSLLGIARETAALLGKKLKIPRDIRKDLKPDPKFGKRPSFEVVLKSAQFCRRYTARIIKEVEIKPSPDWLKERIISVGLRPVNNIVDITNFVLFETGQPMHAFDLDRIKGGIYVRRAGKGEKIITIDNIPRTCDEDMLVIADKEGPIAIGGVMGGLTTEVNNMTRNILLESAFFDPVSIRRTSRTLGLGSESSYRFERRIDNDMVLKASNRASALIKEIAKGKIGPLFDVGNKTSYSKTINFGVEKSNAVLGISMSKKEVIGSLKALGFSAEDKKGFVKVTPPSFREDVKSDIDLIEEVARVYGYERIPLTVPRVIGNTKIKDFIDLLEERISALLTRFDLNEIITYSLIKKDSLLGFGIPEERIVPIKNPLSIDQEIMRPTLLPGVLKCISYNFNRKARRLSFFEVGKVYEENKGEYTEKPVLSVALTGVKREDWKGDSREFDFFDLKGIFEKLLGEIGLRDIIFKKGNARGLDENISSVAECAGETVACLGEVARNIRERYDIEKKVFYGEVYIERLRGKVKLDRKYVPYGRYPSVTRDISVVSEKEVTSHDITAVIKEIGRRLVREITLLDCYKGKQIPEGKRAFLYRIEYRSDEKTLEDTEVDRLHSEIKNTLAEKMKITFR